MEVRPEIAKPVPPRYQLNVRLRNSMVFQGNWIFPAVFRTETGPEERLKCIAYNLMHYSGLDILAERDTDAGKGMDRVILSQYC